MVGPCRGSTKWVKSDGLLMEKLEKVAGKNKWIRIRDQLPLLMSHFRMHEHLYCDMRRPRPGEIFQPPRTYTQEERDVVWRLAKIRFPDVDHQEVWYTFKMIFQTYMDDLEMGIENPWPRLWWLALEKLRFLVNVRYHPLEPYYYIVHTKIREEVQRCSIFVTMMTRHTADKTQKSNAWGNQVRIDSEPLPWDTEEAKRLLTGN
ncbi:uncharacterized protein LOC111074735 [Drosophila obscura]|uniref:uncharacterized protein LOC111074735 n=1 Tax=Drosophila obscura TaxID=7282 RepID=UPI001BB164EA|nr:uncharacterized protein LOC111074735 [Drosophila obscura]